jgi:hypothetical protein
MGISLWLTFMIRLSYCNIAKGKNIPIVLQDAKFVVTNRRVD